MAEWLFLKISSGVFGLVTGFYQASAQVPPRGIYSDVNLLTLPSFWPSSCKQKWYMDLSGSDRAPRFPCVSAIFGCHTIPRVYQSEIVWAHSAWTYHWGLERAWQFDTTWDSPFQQNYESLTHTHFGVPLGIAPDWWDDRKRINKPVLPLYFRLDGFQQSQPCTFLPSPFLPQLSGPKNVSS